MNVSFRVRDHKAKRPHVGVAVLGDEPAVVLAALDLALGHGHAEVRLLALELDDGDGLLGRALVFVVVLGVLEDVLEQEDVPQHAERRPALE